MEANTATKKTGDKTMATTTKRRPKTIKLTDCQLMEMALLIAAREEKVVIFRNYVEEAAKALFSRDFELFLSCADQYLTRAKVSPEVAYLVQAAVRAFGTARS